MDPLLAATAVACAAMGGVFFAFSTFVMKALARLPAPQGIAVMQSINVVAVTPLFMTALFGTAVACVYLAVEAVRAWSPAGVFVLAATASYLAGCILVTIAFNVPLNNALAAADPSSADAARLWGRYLRLWTAWNHVRTVVGLAAGVLLTLALLERR